MHVNKIFLDLDDVLNTFTLDALKVWGCHCPTYADFPAAFGYDLPGAAHFLGCHLSKEEMWDALPRKLWSDTTKSPECDWLVERCAEAVGPANVFIATSTTKSPDCLAGKLEWIVNYLPSWLHRHYVITPRKWLLAQQGCLLIDDCTANCIDWSLAGGACVYFPRPWNLYRGVEPRQHLSVILQHYFPNVEV